PQPAEPGGITLLGDSHGDVPRGVPCRVRPAYFAAQFLDRIPMPAGRAVLVAAPLARPGGLVPFLVALALGSPLVLARARDAAVATPADWRGGPGTVGRAPFGCRIVLRDPDGKRIDEPGRVGILYVGNLLADRVAPGADPAEGGLVASEAAGHFDRAGRLFLD